MTTANPPEPGRIVMVAFPFTDATATKYRPALVVSGDAFHDGEDFVAVPISSRLEQRGFQILRTCAYFTQTQLSRDSTVKWEKLMTISSRIVIRQLGTVPDGVLKQIQGHIKSMFS